MQKLIFCLFISIGLVFISFSGLSAGEYKLPDTGQHTCYDDEGNVIDCPNSGEPFYGQDAQYQGPEPSYQDNGDGTVTDLNTGLMWQQATADTDGDGDIDSNDKLVAPYVYDYCDSLDYAGYSDWRIPDIREFFTIVDYGNYDPAMNPVFSCQSSKYWTGSTSAYSRYRSWEVNFNNGKIFHRVFNNEYFIRCVRGNRTPTQTLIDNFDGTITDNSTNLMWEKKDDDQKRTWQEALAYCQQYTKSGYSDWRLPNVRELKSLVYYGSYDPAINSIFDCSSENYWSSSTYTRTPGQAWHVNFSDGFVYNSDKRNHNYVRCVRCGPSGSFDDLTFPLQGTIADRTINLS